MNDIDDLLELFEAWAISVQKEQMKQDREYCACKEESTQAFQAFCAAYPKEVWGACLDLLDLEHQISADEKRFLFRFGLRMGMELGRMRF